MQNPLEITFHNMNHVEAIEKVIHEKFDKVKEISPDITKCHIILDKLSNHHQSGNRSCVRLDIKVPHIKDIIVKEKCGESESELLSCVIKTFKRGKSLLREEVARRRDHKGTPPPDALLQEPEKDSDEFDED